PPPDTRRPPRNRPPGPRDDPLQHALQPLLLDIGATSVVLKPDGERVGALLGAGVDRAVGPAAEQRSDEALRLSVPAWAVGPRAEVAQPQRAAGRRVRE